MELLELPIAGLLLIKPKIFLDARGYFMESFNEKIRSALQCTFVQDNESCSARGVIRGLHFQLPPYEQGKLVRVVRGAAYDVAVDLRVGSSTFGKFHAEILSAQNHHIFWIPPGFAHGFAALEPDTLLLYKVTQIYHAPSDACIRWNDSDLAIPWPVSQPLISEKDAHGMAFSQFKSPFKM